MSSRVNAEAAELMATLFNMMPIDDLKRVPADKQKRIGQFMVDNGYRMVFNCWYLQAEPIKEQE